VSETNEPGLRGKRVLVVGGETLAGRALALALAEAGATVALATLTNSTASDFAVNSALNELWAMNRQGLALVIDASDGEQLRASVERAERELGRFDVVAVLRAESVAVEALGEALPGREVVVLAADAAPEDGAHLVERHLQ
jgi:NAD(P)-dependent dehydrogenase (short-subunit alcohol dehydrogenase family)